MAKQIELFSPDDPVVKDILETCKVYTGGITYDNETGEILYIKVNNLEKKSG